MRLCGGLPVPAAVPGQPILAATQRWGGPAAVGQGGLPCLSPSLNRDMALSVKETCGLSCPRQGEMIRAVEFLLQAFWNTLICACAIAV